MKKGRPPLHPLPGTEAVCSHCGGTFVLSTGQRSDMRHGRLARPCCGGSCQRGMNGAKNGKASAGKISAAMRGKRVLKNAKSTTYLKLYGRHEHRVVMEKHVGRKLTKKEVVHHINGNKHDNAISNLLLCSSQAEHARIHITERLKK